MKNANERACSVRELTAATSNDVEEWLQKVKTEWKQDESTGKWRKLLNAKQFEMVEMVARRVQQEVGAEETAGNEAGEPIAMLVAWWPSYREIARYENS